MDVGANNPLRQELEKMFPDANGEEINLLMELFILASDAGYDLEKTDE